MTSRRPRVEWLKPTAPGEALRTALRFAAPPLDVSSPVPLPSDALASLVEETGVPMVPGATSAKEQAVALLQLAAEIEHALMVQYLYAAASLPNQVGTDGSNHHEALLDIAIEEMCHLATVQNLLLLVDGPPAVHLQRDVLRRDSAKNPLPFVLGPVDRPTLAKYVAVERPAVIPEALVDKVEALVTLAKEEAHVGLRRVGVVYSLLRWMFSDDAADGSSSEAALAALGKYGKIRDADLQPPEEIGRFEATRDEWNAHEDGQLLVHGITSRAAAVAAIDAVAAQGEGLLDVEEASHFERFLALVDAFDNGAVSVTPSAVSPTLGEHGADEGTAISHLYTRLWGEVFSRQYSLVVMSIQFAFVTPRSGDGTPGLRERLTESALAGMRRVIGRLGTLLIGLPLSEGDPAPAGPPYDLDPALLASADTKSLVARHLALLDALEQLYTGIEAAPQFAARPSDATALANLRSRDKKHRQIFDELKQPPTEPERSVTQYRIYPPIGIARLGQDADFFVGPERPGELGGDLQADGSVTPLTRFKDATRTKIRKQAARFHIFESQDGQTWTPAQLPEGAVVNWTVQLANKKTAVTRPSDPPTHAERPVVLPANAGMVIDTGPHQISGLNAASQPLAGKMTSTAANGSPFSVEVQLGQLRTDSQGRLLVLGGSGVSSAPPGVALTGSYYRNPKWFDDVSDGPVTATIQLAPDQAAVQAENGAWLIVAPPDYAPAVACPVTLHDVVRQVGIDNFGAAAPGQPSFERDILPIITRVKRLRFVHDDATWSDPRLDNPELGNPAPAHNPLRKAVCDEVILQVQEIFEGHTLPGGPPYRFRDFQRTQLDQWVAGNFDATPLVPDAGLTADGLTRAALESAAGQGFCPGIEAGIIVLDPTLYIAPFDFRLNHASVQPGDITALMAQPWQADFVKCNTEWWPTQRPDIAPQTAGAPLQWMRGFGGVGPGATHAQMIARSGRLGFIVQQGAQQVFLETERDPTL